MRMITSLLAAAVLGLFAWIRLAPSDPQDWHTDPADAVSPDGNGWLLRAEGGNAPPPRFAVTPEVLLKEADRVARGTPRTRVLAGGVGSGRITYVTRSLLMGYPDYTTITARAAPEGAWLLVHARQRFGQKDMGVNRARVENWVGRLSSRLPRLGD
ncbi:DUF1499 domain-containing protein [Mesobaculum littorinae]|uniref:DUF1499 domain-containing protein n=1 Tax=Mesobaculum littorinae TaxID=2486419 RepID=A0A438AJM8_9RHOB|nr:DUF1499 domain-containing protein [Mesobaculum littorinae]RVV98920.1 DUF1499 domain-containing protein [Mesobaculum littorinae]